ncbi:hypothetical protein [Anaerocolumna jejuensis]|uniref:hypothetical protein n=1 Tax=Anaerocolumna jejuensis TaxID=259063 RepID=UPI0011149C66|nr:hypothetical protein [Anaerocolumna jejuensis]
MKIKKQFSNTRLRLRNPRPNLAARWEGMAAKFENEKAIFKHKIAPAKSSAQSCGALGGHDS